MVDHFFSSPNALQRLHLGPLGEHIDNFAGLLFEQGYARQTARLKIGLVAGLSRWIEIKQLKISGLDEEMISRFLKFRAKHYAPNRFENSTFQALLRHFRKTNVIPQQKPFVEDNVLDRIERAFGRYLSQERGLTQSTLDNYLPIVRRFLSINFRNSSIVLKELTSQDITHFIIHHAHIYSPGRAKLMVTALRSFFHFLYQCGQIGTDLAKCVPTVANWGLSELPKFLKPEEVECLLQSCDQSTPIGQRDYAVLLLLARLGLRAGEVVHMVIEDIDWDKGELIVRGKSPRQDRLPLPQDVGEALATYLVHVRPTCSSRRVFIRMLAPYQGFSSSSAIRDIVRRAFRRLGFHRKNMGAHLLRHSLATRMLHHGASLNEIGEILRHKLPQTTEIYAKVNIVALRDLAKPWPGGVDHE
mgnify:CR=1 FL=1